MFFSEIEEKQDLFNKDAQIKAKKNDQEREIQAIGVEIDQLKKKIENRKAQITEVHLNIMSKREELRTY
jgi:chromosome segregation ATPase